VPVGGHLDKSRFDALREMLGAVVTLLPVAAAATGLPALAAAWLALWSSGSMNSSGLPSAFSNSAFETVPSRPAVAVGDEEARAARRHLLDHRVESDGVAQGRRA